MKNKNTKKILTSNLHELFNYFFYTIDFFSQSTTQEDRNSLFITRDGSACEDLGVQGLVQIV